MGRMPAQLVGGWELGLLVLMAILFAGGALINPGLLRLSGDAFLAILRDTARYAVMAVGMTFVIINKDLDLSVGSTNGLIGVAFPSCSRRSSIDWGPIAGDHLLPDRSAPVIGLINGVLVTILRVPSFIATLTILLIGRGIILGLTGGKSIGYAVKAREYPGFFHLGETNAFGFNNQIPIALVDRRRSAPSCSPRRAGATRPSRPAATSRPPPMPASRPAGCASAPICCRRSAPPSPG